MHIDSFHKNVISKIESVINREDNVLLNRVQAFALSILSTVTSGTTALAYGVKMSLSIPLLPIKYAILLPLKTLFRTKVTEEVYKTLPGATDLWNTAKKTALYALTTPLTAILSLNLYSGPELLVKWHHAIGLLPDTMKIKDDFFEIVNDEQSKLKTAGTPKNFDVEEQNKEKIPEGPDHPITHTKGYIISVTAGQEELGNVGISDERLRDDRKGDQGLPEEGDVIGNSGAGNNRPLSKLSF